MSLTREQKIINELRTFYNGALRVPWGDAMTGMEEEKKKEIKTPVAHSVQTVEHDQNCLIGSGAGCSCNKSQTETSTEVRELSKSDFELYKFYGMLSSEDVDVIEWEEEKIREVTIDQEFEEWMLEDIALTKSLKAKEAEIQYANNVLLPVLRSVEVKSEFNRILAQGCNTLKNREMRKKTKDHKRISCIEHDRTSFNKESTLYHNCVLYLVRWIDSIDPKILEFYMEDCRRDLDRLISSGDLQINPYQQLYWDIAQERLLADLAKGY